ncbi:MAG: cardiolipin synthase [Verrucomicrobia bacterium]|nr:cardiolipin synthase [Verrucomicrobiota bacterium]
MLVYVPQKRSTAASRTWLLLIFLLPWPGLFLYALFGRIRLPKHRLAQQQRASRMIRLAQAQVARSLLAAPDLPPNLLPVADLATRLGDFEPFGGNSVELLPEYQGSIDRLIADVEAARHHVHLLSYIFEPDATGSQVAAALIKAAKRGVTCRVLLDAVGSRRALRRLAPRLRAAGVEVHAALPVGFFRRNAARFDLRNHRKLAVVDGRIGYAGSQNIADPAFVKNYPNEELVVRLTGPVVAQLQSVFLADHYFETGARIPEKELFPALTGKGTSTAHVVPSGPGYARENAEELIIALLYAARERVVITTPYFVPDDVFLQALRSAALRGVDVHLVLSLHANQTFTQFAQRAYYGAVIDAGVKIHLYRPHFLHAKHLTVDNAVALVGSTNIDIRSFALNAEIMLVIYDPEVVASLRTLQEKYFADSDVLTPENWEGRPLLLKVAQNTARLADSFL